MQIHGPHSDVTVLSDTAEIPGLGFLPVNSFVLHATEPVVVDTGLGTEDKDFVSTLAQVMDPSDVRWIWLTHPDRDHTGVNVRRQGVDGVGRWISARRRPRR